MVETYVPGMMIQNIRLACEAMGLGHWNFCGFTPEILFGAYPEVTPGLKAVFEEPNPKAPLPTGALKCRGWPGVKEATYVPSPRYPDAEALVTHWYNDKCGEGSWLADGANNLLRKGMGGWKDGIVEGIIRHPKAPIQSWVWEALTAHIDASTLPGRSSEFM